MRAEVSFIPFILHFIQLTCISGEIVNCTSDADCHSDSGNSACIQKVCECKEGYLSEKLPRTKHGKNCIDPRCGDGKCYLCIDSSKCKRCTKFVVEGSGQCVDSCSTTFSFKYNDVYEGRVCKAETEKSSLSEGEIIGIVVGITVAVIVLGVVLAFIFYFKLSKSCRSDEELNGQSERRRSSQTPRLSNEIGSKSISSVESKPEERQRSNDDCTKRTKSHKKVSFEAQNGRPPEPQPRLQYEI